MRILSPYGVAFTGVILAVSFGLMLLFATFFNTSKANDCKYTLLVGAGGIKDALCVDFNNLKKIPHESNTSPTRRDLGNYSSSYYGTGILPHVRVQAQICEAGLQ